MSITSSPLRPDYRAALGMITPSANLVVERVTCAILSDFPEVSAHFSRTPVFGARDLHPDDYDWDGMLGAARLLAQARPDVIVWNGSKGATLGFSADRELCRRVTEQTGIPATTSTLALEAALGSLGAHRIAVVAPYASDYQRKLVAGFEREGLEVVAEAHSGIADNLDYAAVPDAAIAGMIRAVATARPDAILAWCTNFPAAYVVDALERDLDIPILDSVTLAVWHGLHMAGRADPRGRRWGRLFDRPTQ
ncbi:maleate isomerase [Ancylobacter sp. 3268]|uniref:maleate cis-trans isomerase family protein n=1 Tax=Ancylobacter sp. 3268 TaxID=2817752 RepID=UPI00285D2EB3|nr:aspartate/glutamate racemase family protein [Ancylobacter sp. 3268]MDR6955396.1 maleate isomerase [Ancylobacter sp. 3268]